MQRSHESHFTVADEQKAGHKRDEKYWAKIRNEKEEEEREREKDWSETMATNKIDK